MSMEIIDQHAVIGNTHNVEEVWRALRRTLVLLPGAAQPLPQRPPLGRNRPNPSPSSRGAGTKRDESPSRMGPADISEDVNLDLSAEAVEACGASLRFALGVFNAAGDSIDPASRGHFCTLFAELFVILGDVAESERLYNEAYSTLTAHYGRDHLAISDFFCMMSAVRANAGRFMDAIKYSGRALAIRIARLGLVHAKTADCHFNLGLLYRMAEDLQTSLKHLRICREIRVVAFHEVSEEVAAVDESIGYTEVLRRSLDKAYLALYLSYRARCVLFGQASASARQVAEYVAQVRYSCGTRFVAAIEVRDKIRSLAVGDNENGGDANNEKSGKEDQFLALIVAAMDQDDRAVYTLVDLKDLILACAESVPRSKSKFLERIAPTDATTATVANAAFIELMEPLHSEDFARIFRLETHKKSSGTAERTGAPPRRLFNASAGGNDSDSESSHESADYHRSAEGAAELSRGSSRSHSVVLLAAQAEEEEKERAAVRRKLREDSQVADAIRLRRKSLVSVDGPASNAGAGRSTTVQMRLENVAAREPDATSGGDAIAAESTAVSSAVAGSQNESVAQSNHASSHSDTPVSPPQPVVGSSSPAHQTTSNATPAANSNAVAMPQLRLGARSVLLVQDAEGKPAVVRGAGTADVLEALQHRVFASGIFVHLLSGSKAKAVPMQQKDKNYVEAPTRDKSKPVQAVPSPPPLPVGWPPRCPADEDTGAATHKAAESVDEGSDVKPKNALASLFGALGAKQLKGAKDKTSDAAQEDEGTQVKLKQIHWDVVPIKAAQGTLWDEGTDDSPDEYAQVDTENLFPDLMVDFELIKVAPAKATVGAGRPAGGGGLPIDLKSAIAGAQKKIAPPPSSALDAKRSQNLTIMLSKFGKTSSDVIAQAVQEFNLEAINQNVIQIMIDQLPTGDEQQAVKKRFAECGSDASKLDRAEQYVLETSKITKFGERLRFMQILMASEDSRDVVSRDAELIVTLSLHLRESLKYRRLMHVLLSVGNALNKGSKKNVALGFRLSSLSKLLQTKSNTGLSLLEYVVSTLMAKDPVVLTVTNDFAGLEDARRVMFSNMRADVAKISGALKLGSDLLEAARKADEAPTAIAKIENGINQMTQLVAQLNALIEEATKEFAAACEYLGEPVSDPEALFGQLQAFLAALAKAQREAQEKGSRDKRRASLLVSP